MGKEEQKKGGEKIRRIEKIGFFNRWEEEEGRRKRRKREQKIDQRRGRGEEKNGKGRKSIV